MTQFPCIGPAPYYTISWGLCYIYFVKAVFHAQTKHNCFIVPIKLNFNKNRSFPRSQKIPAQTHLQCIGPKSLADSLVILRSPEPVISQGSTTIYIGYYPPGDMLVPRRVFHQSDIKPFKTNVRIHRSSESSHYFSCFPSPIKLVYPNTKKTHVSQGLTHTSASGQVPGLNT